MCAGARLVPSFCSAPLLLACLTCTALHSPYPSCRSCWASRAQPTPKHIVYGATDLLAGEQFLQQLSTLGHKSGAAAAQTY